MKYLVRKISAVALMVLLLSSCNQQKANLIVPPIAGLEQVYERINFDAQKGGILTTATGSVIEVPANAFIDSLGNLVKGNVQLKYREMHTAADIFLSGIPMRVNGKDKSEVLASAVMWEVRASQDGHSLELDSTNDKTIKTGIASFVEGSEYDLWSLNENTRGWDNLQAVQPTPNPSKVMADSIARAYTTKRAELDLSECVVFNYYSILDVWEKPKDNIFNYYYGYDETPEKSHTKKLKKRVEGFGMNWVYAKNDYQSVTYYGREYPASMVVWEVEKEIPAYILNNKDLDFECKKISRHRYLFSLYKGDNWDDSRKKVHSVVATIKMPLKMLYVEGKENWITKKDSITVLLEAQEKRLATLGSVMRTMEISKMGIYNYDRLLDKQDDIMVTASFGLDNEDLMENEDLMVFVYLEKENTVIKYSQYDMDKFVLYPEADYQVFCVTGPNQLALFPVANLKEVTGLIPTLKDMEHPPVHFDMVKYEKSVETADDFNAFLDEIKG